LVASAARPYTASFSSLAGRDAIFLLALILMASPVAGFHPILAARFRTWRMPKPVRRILAPCSSKVSGAFIWPVFSAFRLLLEENGAGELRFKTDPIALFEEKKAELSATFQNTFDNQGRVVQQVGKATDACIRLEGQIQMEMLIRERLKAD
jgi:hypothetical protein